MPTPPTSRLAAWVPRLWVAEWVGLVVLAPFYLFPNPFTTPLLLAVPIFWGLWKVATGHFGVPSPLDGCLLVFWVMVLVSEFATYDLGVSLPKLAGLVLGLWVYMLMARTASVPQGWIWPVLALLLAGLGIAGAGLLGMPSPLTKGLTRLQLPGLSAALQPNEVAGTLLWIIPLPLGLLVWWFRGRVSLSRRLGAGVWPLGILLLVLLNLFLLGTLALTQSRGSYIGLALAILVMFVWGLEGRWRVGLAGLLVVACGGLAVVFGPTLIAHLPDLLVGRFEIWQRAIFALSDYGFTGLGLNTFRYLVQILYPISVVGPVQDLGHAHNEFLQAGLDLGIPGLIAFISLYVGSGWMLWNVGKTAHLRLDLKRNRHIRLAVQYLTISLGAGLLAHLFFGMTDAVSFGAKPGFVFWMVLGLIVGIYRQVTQEPALDEEQVGYGT